MYGIIGAMTSEITLLRDQMQELKEHEIGTMVFYMGLLKEAPCVLVKCGIGKVNAAVCAQLLIDRFGVDKIINTGIAGGVGAGLKVGDIVIGTSSVQYDFDMQPLGYAKGYMDGPDRTKFTIYESDKGLVEEFKTAVKEALPNQRVLEGRIATGDKFVADAALKAELRDHFGAIAAEMEGAAIAHVTEKNDVAAVIIRAISDLADEGASESVENFEQLTADASATILLHMLERAVTIPVLV